MDGLEINHVPLSWIESVCFCSLWFPDDSKESLVWVFQRIGRVVVRRSTVGHLSESKDRHLSLDLYVSNSQHFFHWSSPAAFSDAFTDLPKLRHEQVGCALGTSSIILLTSSSPTSGQSISASLLS